jgi:hypothetical protein
LQLRSRFDLEAPKVLIEVLGGGFVTGYVVEKGLVDIWNVYQRAVAVAVAVAAGATAAGVARVVEQHALMFPELPVHV